jgi:hypothetical protein
MTLSLLNLSVCRMGNDPVVSKSSELLRLGLMPSVDELKAGKVCFLLWNMCTSVDTDIQQDVLSIDISTANSLKRVTS